MSKFTGTIEDKPIVLVLPLHRKRKKREIQCIHKQGHFTNVFTQS